MHNYANSANFDARKMKFSPFDGTEGDEHSGVGLVEISKIFVSQNEFFYGTPPFDNLEYQQMPMPCTFVYICDQS